VHLVGFIIRIYHDASSSEYQIQYGKKRDGFTTFEIGSNSENRRLI